MFSHGFFPKITLPTRFSAHSCSLIDNFFCKLTSNTLYTSAGILLSDMSDHLPYFICLDSNNKTTPCHPNKIQICTNSEAAIQGLCSGLHDSHLYDNLDHHGLADANLNYDVIHNTIAREKSTHMPIRTVKFNKHRHKLNKWMTYGILKSIRYKDNMCAKMKSLHPETYEHFFVKNNLKVYNKILKKTIKGAKQRYYFAQFSKYQKDMKNTWNTIGDVLKRNNTLAPFAIWCVE